MSTRFDDVSGKAQASAGFWHRRVLALIRAQLTQGVAPDKITATLAVGTACSLFPFLGATSALNFVAGLALRMNQPILQVLNQLLGPVQLALILVYVRLGEWIMRADGDHFTVGQMIHVFRDETFAAFLRRFGSAGVHALVAWLITTPVLIAAIYLLLRPMVSRFASREKFTPTR